MNVFENARIFHLGCFQSDQLDRRTEIDSQMNRVFVGNLPKDIVESELRVGIMEVVRKIRPKTQIIKVGRARVNPLSHPLSQIFLPRPFRGYAFVTLDNPKVAAKLIKRRDLLLTIDGEEHKCFANAAEHKTPDNRGGGVGMMMQRGGGHVGGDFDALSQRAGMWAPTPGMQHQHSYSMPSYVKLYPCLAKILTRIADGFGGVDTHMATSTMAATGYGHQQLQSSSVSGYQPSHQSPYGAPQQQHSYMPQSTGVAPAQQFGGWNSSSSGGFRSEFVNTDPFSPRYTRIGPPLD